MIPWLVWDVQLLVAMVTRSVISSEQFSAVQHVEMMNILFLLHLAQALPTMFASVNTIGKGNFERIKFS